MAMVCSCCHPVHQMLSLLPCTVTANGVAGHNRGEVAETPPLARTQGRTVSDTMQDVSQAGKAQDIGDPLNPVVITSWKNHESSDTTRVVKFLVRYPFNSIPLRHYVFDVLSSSSAVSSSASDFWITFRRICLPFSSPRRLRRLLLGVGHGGPPL